MQRPVWESNPRPFQYESNAVLFSYLGNQYNAVHKAVTIYYSSSAIFT